MLPSILQEGLHACRYREFYPGFFAGTGDVNDNEKEEGGMI